MNSHLNSENEIRALIDTWLKACRNQDITGIVANYADNIVAYDAIMALQFTGLEAYTRHWKFCMEQCPGPMIFEIPELTVVADENSAFSYGLIHCGAVVDNEEQSSWMRVTICWRKLDNRWQVVHEHYSEPFDPESGKALFDLKP